MYKLCLGVRKKRRRVGDGLECCPIVVILLCVFLLLLFSLVGYHRPVSIATCLVPTADVRFSRAGCTVYGLRDTVIVSVCVACVCV